MNRAPNAGTAAYSRVFGAAPSSRCLVVLAAAAVGLTFTERTMSGPGLTEMVSVNDEGVPGDEGSLSTSISADGRVAAYASTATNLVPGSFDGLRHVYVRDRDARLTTRVSVAGDGRVGNAESFNPSLSHDGRFVAFSSEASNLVPDDTNGDLDAFVHDRVSGKTSRVSLTHEGTEIDGDSFINLNVSAISADGRYVAFSSLGRNVAPADTNRVLDVFVRDRVEGTTELISRSSLGEVGNDHSFSAAISADGRFVAFGSFASNLVQGDTNSVRDVFVYDRVTGLTTRASVASNGEEGNAPSFVSSISGDGGLIGFFSDASNLASADTNGVRDVFVHDCLSGLTTRVSVSSGGEQGNGVASGGSISADGRYVAFDSAASNLVNDDANDRVDVFVHDRFASTTTLESVTTDGAQGTSGSLLAQISAGGRHVVFVSVAANLTGRTKNLCPGFPPQGTFFTTCNFQVFVHDR